MPIFRRSAIIAPTIGLGLLAASVPVVTQTVGADQHGTDGGIGLRLTEAPTSAADDPRARVYIVDHLTPGTVIERTIEVSNTTASSQRVVLYAAAASIDDGTFVGAADDTPNELSSWTSVTPSTSEVAAGEFLTATVNVAVPADAAPGEMYGVVWAEVSSDPGDGGGVIQVSRVGIRMYVSVGPGGAPAADFTIDSVTASRSEDEGLPMVSALVHNTGGRALDMTGTLMLTNGPGGLSAGPFVADLGRTLAIADTQSVRVTLDALVPAGPWDASITLASGLTTRTVEATITFPDDGATTVDTRTPGSTNAWIVASVLAVLAALAAAVTFGVLRMIRRRPRLAVALRPPS